MLISIQSSETIVATVIDNYLVDLDIENYDTQSKKTNIYRGKIARIEPSLDAVFIDYGEAKHGFLPFKEIAPDYFRKGGKSSSNLNDMLQVGQHLIVQIVKEVRRNKGASLTTYIALAGCYIVLLPNSPTVSGISRCTDLQQRNQLKKILEQLDVPNQMGVIIRTAAIERNLVEIKHDLKNLILLWGSIQNAYNRSKGTELLYRESNITIRAIRDYLKEDIAEIIVDDEETYQELRQVLNLLKPKFLKLLYLYTDQATPLFEKFKLEDQIESVFHRQINLKSGGSIVIDSTEALTAIDVNSARSTKGENIEETAFLTNMEATSEIARQLRLRDVSGLIIIDFIDMGDSDHQEKVEAKLAEELSMDRARIQMTKISKLGIVELSRQHLQSPLRDSIMQLCPQCQGNGRIRSVRSCANLALRSIKHHSQNIVSKNQFVSVQLPLEVAAHLLNYSRAELITLERLYNTKILVVINSNLTMPNMIIEPLSAEDIQPLAPPTIVKRPVLDFTSTIAGQSEPMPESPNYPDKKRIFSALWSSLKDIFWPSQIAHLEAVNSYIDKDKTVSEQKSVKPSRQNRFQLHKSDDELIVINDMLSDKKKENVNLLREIAIDTSTGINAEHGLELKDATSIKEKNQYANSAHPHIKKGTSKLLEPKEASLPPEIKHAIKLAVDDVLQVETTKKVSHTSKSKIRKRKRIKLSIMTHENIAKSDENKIFIKYSPSLDPKRQGYK